jgi:hypothetical protein
VYVYNLKKPAFELAKAQSRGWLKSRLLCEKASIAHPGTSFWFYEIVLARIKKMKPALTFAKLALTKAKLALVLTI